MQVRALRSSRHAARASAAHRGRRPAPQWRRRGAGWCRLAQRRRGCLASREQSGAQSYSGTPRPLLSSCGPAAAAARRPTAPTCGAGPWSGGGRRRGRRSGWRAPCGLATQPRPAHEWPMPSRVLLRASKSHARRSGKARRLGGTPRPWEQAAGRQIGKAHDHTRSRGCLDCKPPPCIGPPAGGRRQPLECCAAQNFATILQYSSSSNGWECIWKKQQQMSAADMAK